MHRNTHIYVRVYYVIWRLVLAANGANNFIANSRKNGLVIIILFIQDLNGVDKFMKTEEKNTFLAPSQCIGTIERVLSLIENRPVFRATSNYLGTNALI